MPGLQPCPVIFSDKQGERLKRLCRRQTSPQHLVRRAKTILLAAEGLHNEAIATELGISRNRVSLWRGRWDSQTEGLEAAEAAGDRDRALLKPIEMSRKLTDEKVEKFRLDQLFQFEDLKRQCVRWALDHEAAIQATDPSLPAFLNDRAANNWRTLCAIAEVAAFWPFPYHNSAFPRSHPRYRLRCLNFNSPGICLLTA